MSSAPDLSLRSHGPGGTTEELRRSNLARILGLVHREGELSRAELTRLTGLNRSTIGGLVGELRDLGLIVESMPELGGVGRASSTHRRYSDGDITWVEFLTKLRSSASSANVTVRIGKAKATSVMLASTLQANIGIFISVMLGARILSIVTRKFMPLSILPTPAICNDHIQ